MGWFLNLILPRNVVGISIAPFGIFLRKTHYWSTTKYVHEYIHWRQQWEMGVIFFYLWYVIEYFYRWYQLGSKKKAYKEISFEKEAYTNEWDWFYPTTGKHYSWIKYLKKKE